MSDELFTPSYILLRENQGALNLNARTYVFVPCKMALKLERARYYKSKKSWMWIIQPTSPHCNATSIPSYLNKFIELQSSNYTVSTLHHSLSLDTDLHPNATHPTTTFSDAQAILSKNQSPKLARLSLHCSYNARHVVQYLPLHDN